MNYQILGFIKAENDDIARKTLLVENQWITESGFDSDEIIVGELV